MAAEISRGNETIGTKRDEERREGGMRSEGGRIGKKGGPRRGPEGGRSSALSLPREVAGSLES